MDNEYMLLYHGGTQVIKNPLSKVGREGLDFGQGFYTTDMFDQARLWADRVHRQRHEVGLINVYEFDMELAHNQYRFLKFDEYDIDWLNFIAECRTGGIQWKEYDYIEGGIANDRVIDTVESYISGTMDAQHALVELSKHRPNNQICLINQHLIDDCLKYKETIEC